MGTEAHNVTVTDDPAEWRRRLRRAHTRLRMERLNLDAWVSMRAETDPMLEQRALAARERWDEEAAAFRASLAAYVAAHGPLDLPML